MRLRMEENEAFHFPPELLMSDDAASLVSDSTTDLSSTATPDPESRAAALDSSPSPFVTSSQMQRRPTLERSRSATPVTPLVYRPPPRPSKVVEAKQIEEDPQQPPPQQSPPVLVRKQRSHSLDSATDDVASPNATLFLDDAEVEDDGVGDVDDEEAQMDRLQRFLDGDDRMHFRSLFNVGRVTGMTKTAAILLVCKESVYCIDDFFFDRDAMEIVEVDRGPAEGASSSASSSQRGSRSPSPSPSPVQGSSGADSARSAGGRPRSTTGSSASLRGSHTSRDVQRTALLGHESRKWTYAEIADLAEKRYLLQNVAIELFSIDGRNEFFSFDTKREKADAWKQLSRAWQAYKTRAAAVLEETSSWRKMSAALMGVARSGLGQEDTMLSRWRQGLVSNFEYLMYLNSCAGRTYNDLTQYPVFPWILSDYESERLDLSDVRAYRDLSKPMGAQTDERAATVAARYRDYDPAEHDTPAFHYGTHYSSAAAVLYYLVRLEPFSSQFVYELQGGRFDQPDRTFASVRNTWKSAAGYTGATADVKELIPEWFSMGDFLRNSNRFLLGVRSAGSGGNVIDDVELPAWAQGNERLFIMVNRMALESQYVSQHLHEWIDLIFGFKQRGPDAVAALNVFHHLSYEGEVNIEDITDPVQRKATVDAIFNFGQTPRQLFVKPHPPRAVTDAFKLGLDHPFARLTRARAPAMLGYELLQDSGPPVASLLYKQASSTVALGRPLHGWLLGGAKAVRADYPDHSLRLYAGTDGRLLYVTEGVHDGAVRHLACSGEYCATGGADGVVAVLRPVVTADGPQLSLMRHLTGHRGAITALVVSHAWNIIVSAAAADCVILWDLHWMKLVRQLKCTGDAGDVSCIEVDEHAGYIATGMRSGLNLFDVNGTLLAAVAAPPVTSIAFVKSHFVVLGAVTLVTGHADGVVRLFRMDASVRHHVATGVDLGGFVGVGDERSGLPFVLLEAYAYTAHASAVTAMCMVPGGLVSADAAGKIVRTFGKEEVDGAVAVKIEQ